MRNDLSQGSAAVFAERRRNKTIWFRGCMALALIVAMLTSYVLIFPARTEERTLICGRTEHVHDENCWLEALSCQLEEGEEHRHGASCYTRVLVCGLEEHSHSEDCYAELAPAPELTNAPETEPVPETEPAPATEPVTETGEPVETEPAIPEQTPEQTPAVGPDAPAPAEPAGTEPVETEPVETEPAEPEPNKVEFGPGRHTALPLNEFPETGIDLAPYLESVVFQRQDGTVLIEDTLFENGSTAKALIVYDIPRDVVTPESKYVYYQLPEGVRPIEETSGDVMDEGVPVGVYTITEDGLIHILFNDEFANGNAIVGTVEFTSWLYANEDGTDRVVEFENEAGTITIYVPDEQKYDLAMEKTGDFGSDYKTADFVLTVSSALGTGAPINVTDTLTNQTPATLFSAAYHKNLTVRHVAADGSVTQLTDLTPVWSEDGMSFSLEALPALEAGERYELLYTVDLDPDLSGSFELDNEASATAGSLEANTSFFISYVCDITKSGTFNPNTGLIDWVITVNPESRPVAGWRIEDDLPSPAVGKVLLTNANGVRYADLTPEDGRTIRYTFPPNAPAKPYFIRYSTVAPTTAETVRNIARLINERETTVVSEVEVDERSEGVDKTLGAKHLEPNGMVRTDWSFHVTLPVGELESYSFRDNISTPVMDVNSGEYLDNNLHFAYAAELDAAFRGNLRLVSDGAEYRYGDEANDYVSFELSYYDSQGALIDPADETTHVARVVFTLNPLKGNSFHGYEIVAEDYPTWLDTTGAQEGDYWAYQNYVYLHGGIYDMAPAFYRKGNAFQKQLLVGGRYSDENDYVDYGDCAGVLEYRLLLDLTALAGENFTVTDLLPAGVELIEDSPRAYFTTANLHGEYNGTFAQDDCFSWTAEPAEDGGTLLRFTGSGVSELMKQSYAYIGIVYRVRLLGDELWNDYTHSVVDLTNTAAWEDYTDSHTVRVENQPTRIEKSGVQLTDPEGAPLSRVRFRLLINAAAEDLNPESDWILLTDRLSSGIGANLELGSVKLYHFDPKRPDGVGNPVREYEYKLSYDTGGHLLNVTMKDNTAYLLFYEYSVDNTAILDGQTTIHNEAVLAGQFRSDSDVVLKSVSSSATAWQRVITITKVDSENHAKVLPGAEFTLEHWNPELQAWEPELDENGEIRSYVSNEAGKIILSMLGEEKDLNAGTLYRMTEIKAPVGYENGDTCFFFLCLPRYGAEDQEAVFAEAGAGSDVSFDQVTFFNWNGGSCVITNPFSGLTVNKRWFAFDGTEMTDPTQDSIRVTLYATTDPDGETGLTPVAAGEGVENPVTLSKQNNWSYTWDKLPGGDEEGNTLYYFVAEDPVPGFTPRYVNNGIHGGTVVICNEAEPYELPATGGEGVDGIAMLGVLLMLLSAVVYYRNRSQKIKKMEELQ